MSFQITVLKVLAGHPDGRLSLDDLKRAVAILISSGSNWTDRTKRLAARALASISSAKGLLFGTMWAGKSLTPGVRFSLSPKHIAPRPWMANKRGKALQRSSQSWHLRR
jgi:hypothetical protein